MVRTTLGDREPLLEEYSSAQLDLLGQKWSEETGRTYVPVAVGPSFLLDDGTRIGDEVEGKTGIDLEQIKELKEPHKIIAPMNLGRDHWVGFTISLQNGKAEISFLDSLASEVRSDKRASDIEAEKARIAKIFNDAGYTTEVKDAVVQQQKDRVSCGAYFMENAGRVLGTSTLSIAEPTAQEIRGHQLALMREPSAIQGVSYSSGIAEHIREYVARTKKPLSRDDATKLLADDKFRKLLEQECGKVDLNNESLLGTRKFLKIIASENERGAGSAPSQSKQMTDEEIARQLQVQFDQEAVRGRPRTSARPAAAAAAPVAAEEEGLRDQRKTSEKRVPTALTREQVAEDLFLFMGKEEFSKPGKALDFGKESKDVALKDALRREVAQSISRGLDKNKFYTVEEVQKIKDNLAIQLLHRSKEEFVENVKDQQEEFARYVVGVSKVQGVAFQERREDSIRSDEELSRKIGAISEEPKSKVLPKNVAASSAEDQINIQEIKDRAAAIQLLKDEEFAKIRTENAAGNKEIAEHTLIEQQRKMLEFYSKQKKSSLVDTLTGGAVKERLPAGVLPQFTAAKRGIKRAIRATGLAKE
jgi:hypothetical protein